MLPPEKIAYLTALAKIEKIYPPDDLITSYSDFLQERPLLGYYQFNPNLFQNLLSLTLNLWTTEKRISRSSLLQKLKQYYSVGEQNALDFYTKTARKPSSLPLSIRLQIFELFKKTIVESNYLTFPKLQKSRQVVNYLLINQPLTPEAEGWLCQNIKKSDHIINRVLRYPVKSDVISHWAEENFLNKKYTTRRAELIGWILDHQPEYEVEKEVLIQDFDYLNECDRQAIKDYKSELSADNLLQNELGEFLSKPTWIEKAEESMFGASFNKFAPELNLSRRNYPVPWINYANFPVSVPDFTELSIDFHRDIDTHLKKVMIWAIAYSRLEQSQKTQLLKKYFCKETSATLLTIARREKNADLVRWMMGELYS